MTFTMATEVPSTDEATQIDQLGPLRNWSRPEMDDPAYQTLLSYVSGSLALDDAINALAAPIERAYSDPPQAKEAAERSDNEVSAEGLLWGLWYSVLHTAKRNSWRNATAHDRLLALVKGLKARADPPRPDPMPEKLEGNWIWESGVLWSELLMIGPATRESWNDVPREDYEVSVAEIYAWTNVNSFVARLTAEGIADFVIYSGWMIKMMLEVLQQKKGRVPKGTRLDAVVPPAAVWILQAGSTVRDHGASENKKHSIKSSFYEERWVNGKKAFEEVLERDDVSEETKEIARKAFAKVEELDQI
ncbi:uncharacterized protein BDZ99DRAFT_567027 [Mytilinidion resinicola]|uniref:Uncharacterized protein n=1 Tax=Mytilinidion resinicola TaxID=574789 RepID=A0A6A6Z2A3_9PEZI|nr:uncharacterized protein BDZ99DRAFT_567027 [Mytilinidion resinicola]KAF2815130.1 hypothetical protein BDZ99DRAFT_567027 [Mytilinidion resinicola]